MGGIGSIVPFRYGTKNNDSWVFSTDSIGGKVPSDLYFSDLSSNWKKDSDIYLGEPADKLDYKPELFVGRLLCENASEIDNYTYKLMKYERNPGNGDFSYLHKAFFTQADLMQQNLEANYIADRLPVFFQDKAIFEEKEGPYSTNVPSFPTGDTVIAEMNEGYGLVSLDGHGAPSSIVVASRGNNDTLRHLVIPTRNVVLPSGTIHESANELLLILAIILNHQFFIQCLVTTCHMRK